MQSLFTTREGGVSEAKYKSLNLGGHVNDNAVHVAHNRKVLSLNLPSEPVWLDQQHSSTCVDVDLMAISSVPVNNSPVGNPPLDNAPVPADASITSLPDKVLAVQVADCLPVLLAARNGSRVAVIHAGWRGLSDGIIANVVKQMGQGDLVAWLGPAIGPCHYEVGDDVRQRFVAATGFARAGSKWMMDLYAIAAEQLAAVGVCDQYGGGYCTYCEQKRFYSYRRDGQTGRMAGLIWISSAKAEFSQ